MNKIVSFNKPSSSITCEAGCILEVLNNSLQDDGYMIPLDLGSKGSCQIGGNISTNAGIHIMFFKTAFEITNNVFFTQAALG